MAKGLPSNPLRRFLLQLAGVGVLAAIMHLVLSYPTVFHFADSVPGGMSDGVNALGHVWLVHYNALQGHGDLAFTKLAFYPLGIVFGVRPLLAWYAILGWVGGLFHDNLVLWYNIGMVLSSVFTAMGVYVIALRLTREPVAALLAAVMFTFSPRRMDILQGHTNYYSTGFLIWVTVCIQAGMRKGASMWPWVAAGLLWAMQVWQAPDMMVFIGFVWAPLALWWWWRAWVDHVKGKPVAPLAGWKPAALWAPLVSPIMAGLSLLPILIWTLPYRHMRLSSEQFPWPRTHWFEFLYPSPRHPLYSSWRRLIEEHIFAPGHNEAFIGFAGLLGILLFIAVGANKLRRFRPWLLISAFFLMLTLGTAASFFGAFDIPMPYSLMIHIPVLKELRIPARFNTLFSLGVALMAAIGWAVYYRRNLPSPRLLLAVLFLLAILDGWFAPVPSTKVRNDSRYYPMRLLTEIRNDPDREISVLVVPVDIPATVSQAQQMIHEHPTYDGFDPRLREEQIAQLALGPIQTLWSLSTDVSLKAAEEKMMREGMTISDFRKKIQSLRLKYVLLTSHNNPRAAAQEQIIRKYFPIRHEQHDGCWTMFVVR